MSPRPSLADIPCAETQAEQLGCAAYATWAACQRNPAPQWPRLPDVDRLVWIRVALAAIGLALEFSGAVDDLPPSELPLSGGLH